MDQRFDQLRDALAALPMGEAVVLAGKLEAQRALGQETLPTNTILGALRPQLRLAVAQRVPDLRRLAVMGLEDFLVDDDDRVSGSVPRRAVVPWWQACECFAPQQIKNYAQELARHVRTGDRPALERLGAELHRAAHGWTEAMLADLKAKKLSEPTIRKLLSDQGMQTDFAEIARILAIATPLRAALDAVTQLAARVNQAKGRRILDFAPEVVTEAKQQYLTFTEQFGFESRYMAVGLMHRLQRPCEILRLGRALSWKPDDTMMRDTELGIIGHQLVRGLQALTRAIAVMAPQKGTADTVNYEELGQSLVRYAENAEGMLDEFGFRRDSEWGEQILETRTTLAHLFEGERLKPVIATVLSGLPLKRSPGPRGILREGPDLEISTEPAEVERAVRAARFLMLLAQRGGRHGLSSPARAAIEEIGEEIGNRSDRLFDVLQREPAHANAAAHLTAAIRVAGVLFEDGRGQVMARRLRNLRRAPPREVAAPV